MQRFAEDEFVVQFKFKITNYCLYQLKIQWEQAEEKRHFREQKLVGFDDMLNVNCCRKKCCSGSIELAFLRDLRRKFLDCTSQVERKRFLLNMRDPGSPSGFSIVAGDFVSQKFLNVKDLFYLKPFSFSLQVVTHFATEQ
jgi:hypothetical protein